VKFFEGKGSLFIRFLNPKLHEFSYFFRLQQFLHIFDSVNNEIPVHGFAEDMIPFPLIKNIQYFWEYFLEKLFDLKYRCV
jgi:hypothetical protein